MNPALSPNACSICNNHYKCRSCYVYPRAGQRSIPTGHSNIFHGNTDGGAVSIHENDSIRVTVRPAGDNAAHSHEEDGLYLSSGHGGSRQASGRPSMSGWWCVA